HLVQARLVDGDLDRVETPDALQVDVRAHDVVAELGEAGGGHQADVPCSNDSDLHGSPLVGATVANSSASQVQKLDGWSGAGSQSHVSCAGYLTIRSPALRSSAAQHARFGAHQFVGSPCRRCSMNAIFGQ